MPSDFSRELETRIAGVINRHRLLVDKMKVIVGVSAGSDSLALLYLLHALPMNLQLTAVYIDHRLRPQETDQEFTTVVQSAEELGIPAIRREVDIVGLRKARGYSLEEAARLLRYAALEQVRQNHRADCLAVGHTADDQTEEFFLRLLRGTAAKGLAGMAWQHGCIIRPLLCERKETLRKYLQERRVVWCEDSSNEDTSLMRNRIRHRLIPLLESEYTPALRSTIRQTMDILRHEDQFLDEHCQQVFAQIVSQCKDRGGTGQVEKLKAPTEQLQRLPVALLRRLLEKCCWQLGSRPSFVQISEVSNLIHKGRNDKELHLAKGLRVVQQNGTLIFLRPLPAHTVRGAVPEAKAIDLFVSAPGSYQLAAQGKILRLEECPWPTPAAAAAKGVLAVDRATCTFPLHLRSAAAGERFYPEKGSGSRKVFRYLQDQRIPRLDRPGWPVLVAGDDIIALPGLAVDHRFRCTDRTLRALLIYWHDQERPDQG